MLKSTIAAVALALFATGVVAETDVIKERQQLMKAQGAATKDPGAMLKGEAPFDLAKVQKALAIYVDSSSKFGNLFPENSKTGGDTSASPKIWEDMPGFKAALAKFNSDATKVASEIKDEASFKAHFPAVLKNCGGCHETYRIKKS
jgi:cytochrome c556